MISSNSLDLLVPEFLMHSEQFMFSILDVEGNLLKSSDLHQQLVATNQSKKFSSSLSKDSIQEFDRVFENLIYSPKEKQSVLLHFSGNQTHPFITSWWEFSVVTDTDMDIMAILGVGVGVSFFEQQLPWKSLVDILDFEKIELASDFKFTAISELGAEWLDVKEKEVLGKSFSVVFTSELIGDIEGGDLPIAKKFKRNGKSFFSIITQFRGGYHFYFSPDLKSIEGDLPNLFSSIQLESFPNAVWVADENFRIVQQNFKASGLSKYWCKHTNSEDLMFSLPPNLTSRNKLFKQLKNSLSGMSININFEVLNNEGLTTLWRVESSLVNKTTDSPKLILIQATDLSEIYGEIAALQVENIRLKELALSPSHVLRSPLSSMLGLIDLIDQDQLDTENKKYFSFLKPLASELDEVIRVNAKNISSFD